MDSTFQVPRVRVGLLYSILHEGTRREEASNTCSNVQTANRKDNYAIAKKLYVDGAGSFPIIKV